jgi:hypothetical protein
MRLQSTIRRSVTRDAVRAPILAPLLGCVALLALAACDRTPTQTPSNEIIWARAALERNPNIEVIATDPQAGVFTISIKRTGQTRTVQLGDLAAAPVAELTATALTANPPVGAVPAAAPPTASAEPEPASQTAASQEPPEEPRKPVTFTSGSSDPTKDYIIERVGGRLSVSGPGVSIVSSGAAGPTNRQVEPGQRNAEPVICEGRRMLQFDNRNIYVDGDAIVARGGCELYITNSHVVAAGTGLIVQDATVHIANSTIAGNTASFEAGSEAKIYLRGSTFQGLPRRAEKAVVQDQGGNSWK